MRIVNIKVNSSDTNRYLNNEMIIRLEKSINVINKLFMFNNDVILEFINSDYLNLFERGRYSSIDAIAVNQMIYILEDKVEFENIEKIIIHEYVHICIAYTFSTKCPLWLNEGLAVYISGQRDDIKMIRPNNIESLYEMNYETPNFYNIALYVVNELINKMSLSQIINIGRMCKSFKDDYWLGIETISKYIK